MMTNTYLPHVGGVARSVSTFAHEFVRQGHAVLVVAPSFPGKPLPAEQEAIVERVPALQNFNGSDFSVRLPFAAALSARLDRFDADIIHAHHPFLLGDTALRVAMNKNVPIVFTHHTRYENYAHYVPFPDTMKEIAAELPTYFANLCDGVVAPSESMARLVRQRGVTTLMTVVPTGIDVAAFASADGAKARARYGIPPQAVVVGHVGRLAPEKNLAYLGEALATFLAAEVEARCLVVGDGPARPDFEARFADRGVRDRLIIAGKRTGTGLREAYRAMDVFAFASRSETQGMVVAEAMAAGLPVVALNASGVREVVSAANGVLLAAPTAPGAFAAALVRLAGDSAWCKRLRAGAAETAREFSRQRSARRLRRDLHPWAALVQRFGLEWDILSAHTQTFAAAVFGETKERPPPRAALGR